MPKRRPSTSFRVTVSPLGRDVEETPSYSPSRPLPDGPKGAPKASQTEYAKNERRGG